MSELEAAKDDIEEGMNAHLELEEQITSTTHNLDITNEAVQQLTDDLEHAGGFELSAIVLLTICVVLMVILWSALCPHLLFLQISF